MPRNRQRTTTKAAWTEENLQSAKIAIERGSSIRKAAKQYNIPFSTLKDRLKNEDMSSPRLGRKPVFTQQQETEIAEQVTGFAVLWTQYRRFAKTEAYYYSLIVCHIPFRNESELLFENETAEDCFIRRQSDLCPLQDMLGAMASPRECITVPGEFSLTDRDLFNILDEGTYPEVHDEWIDIIEEEVVTTEVIDTQQAGVEASSIWIPGNPTELNTFLFTGNPGIKQAMSGRQPIDYFNLVFNMDFYTLLLTCTNRNGEIIKRNASGHSLYVDNYYSSVGMAEEFLNKNTYITGTLQFNRKGNPVQVINTRLQPNEACIMHNSNNVTVTKWRDKREISFVSTEHNSEYIQTQNKYGNISFKPKVQVKYNKYMRAVDKHDQMLSYYCAEHKTLRWYKKVIIHVIQINIINAFLMFNLDRETKISLYDFRLQIIEFLLPKKPSVERHSVPGRVHVPDHLPKTGGKKIRKRCRQCYNTTKKRAQVYFGCPDCPDFPGNAPLLCVVEQIVHDDDNFCEDMEERAVMSDELFLGTIRGLNVQQRDLFQKVSAAIENDLQRQASQLLLFITGGAGSGKSFLLKLIVAHIKRCYAPTVDILLKPN
ncbi:hypothetical protein SFRURICE_010704, partial [Spodoptera frugiperda]